MVDSDKVSCNNVKDCRYIVGYQVDVALIPLFIKTPKNIFSYGVSKYDKNSAYTMSFMFLRQKSGCVNIFDKLFEKLATEPIKGGDKYVYGKLKTRKERIKTHFHGQDVPYDMLMAVLKVDSVCKQGKNIILRYMLKSVNTPMQKINNVAC